DHGLQRPARVRDRARSGGGAPGETAARGRPMSRAPKGETAGQLLNELLNRVWLLAEAERHAPQTGDAYLDYMLSVFYLFRLDLARTVERARAVGVLPDGERSKFASSPVAIDHESDDDEETP